jgi:hypothetical protein
MGKPSGEKGDGHSAAMKTDPGAQGAHSVSHVYVYVHVHVCVWRQLVILSVFLV